MLGSLRKYDAVKGVLKHLVKRLGLTDAAVTEVLTAAPDGPTNRADVRYLDTASGKNCNFGGKNGLFDLRIVRERYSTARF